MSDYNIRNHVIQSNYLVQQAKWNYKLNQIKMFKVLVSCIDTKKPNNQTVQIKKTELIEAIGAGKQHYTELKKDLLELAGTPLRIDTEEREIFTFLFFQIIWDKNDDLITCTFHEQIMPYLTELKRFFIDYSVVAVKNLNSKYSIILYENILSRIREQNKKRIRIPMDQLRRLTATENKYLDFRNFENKVLKVAKKDINKGLLEFLMDYEKIKEGRTIVAIDFKVMKRSSCRDTEYDKPYVPSRTVGRI